jgi:GNAT superfamily N-acetyltransferase
MTDEIIVNTQQNFSVQKRANSTLTQKCFGLDWEEAARLAHAHTMTVQKWLSSRTPNFKGFDGIGITATSTGIKDDILNLVLDANFPAGTPRAVMDTEIEAVRSFFAAREVPFSCWISPFAAPSDIGNRLLQHGLRIRDYHLPAMMAPLLSFTNNVSFDPKIKVWQANTVEDLQAASTIRRIAFQFAAGEGLTYFEDMADDWLRGDPAVIYLASLEEGAPAVGMGAIVMGNGLPGVYAMATLPTAEGHGLGKAILSRILLTAKSNGYDKIILTAGARAYSLYRKFGFEHLFEYDLYLK